MPANRGKANATDNYAKITNMVGLKNLSKITAKTVLVFPNNINGNVAFSNAFT